MITKYFGTDGIRGKSFTELNSKIAFSIGQSLRETYNKNQVVIGHDTRNSSPMLAYAIANGAMSVGINVVFAKVVSTPMIAHYSKVKEIPGIMVTASHNPYTDNGIKVFNCGYKSTIEEELIMEKYIDSEIIKGSNWGEFLLSLDINKEYLKVIDKLGLNESSLKVVYDSANGANYLIAKQVMSKYFKNSVQLASEPDGLNINLNCGSTNLSYIREYAKNNNIDIGFSYDGDGDRMLMIDKNGVTYDGDYIIYLIANYLKNKNMLNKNTVVVTKMTNPGILKALRSKNIDYILTDVGDKYVSKELIDNDLSLGGESSGHLIIRDILHSGDGLLSSLFILKLLEEEKIELEDIVKEIELYPFSLVNIKNINKDVLKDREVLDYLEKIKNSLDTDDLFLIRASGTEPLLRVTISVKEEDKLDNLISEVVEFLKKKGSY
ncbi:phosphohexomutase domain-containing protein [Haploplasma modicum]|uniref:hypothetical protein n=1 Tax=Haploplasma modicum TaxID=2150 RepID=UPI000479E50B|nr:hypothetical protein [Haploplasma modicum]